MTKDEFEAAKRDRQFCTKCLQEMLASKERIAELEMQLMSDVDDFKAGYEAGFVSGHQLAIDQISKALKCIEPIDYQKSE